jgi:hypothetical protein
LVGVRSEQRGEDFSARIAGCSCIARAEAQHRRAARRPSWGTTPSGVCVAGDVRRLPPSTRARADNARPSASRWWRRPVELGADVRPRADRGRDRAATAALEVVGLARQQHEVPARRRARSPSVAARTVKLPCGLSSARPGGANLRRRRLPPAPGIVTFAGRPWIRRRTEIAADIRPAAANENSHDGRFSSAPAAGARKRDDAAGGGRRPAWRPSSCREGVAEGARVGL